MVAVCAHPRLCLFLLNCARHCSIWFRQQSECLQKSPTPKPTMVSLIRGRKMICCIISNYKTSISDAKCTYFFRDYIASLQFAISCVMGFSSKPGYREMASEGDARGQILLTFIRLPQVTASYILLNNNQIASHFTLVLFGAVALSCHHGSWPLTDARRQCCPPQQPAACRGKSLGFAWCTGAG